MSYRTRGDANTAFNVIDISGISPKYERVLQSEAELTPGSIVVSFVGAAPPVSGEVGNMGNVKAPDSADNMPIGALDFTSANGSELTGKYVKGDQVPVLTSGGRGTVYWNVRIAATETVTAGMLLTRTTNGSGFATSTGATADNAIGIAQDDLIVSDPTLPTYIKMEVI